MSSEGSRLLVPDFFMVFCFKITADRLVAKAFHYHSCDAYTLNIVKMFLLSTLGCFRFAVIWCGLVLFPAKEWGSRSSSSPPKTNRIPIHLGRYIGIGFEEAAKIVFVFIPQLKSNFFNGLIGKVEFTFGFYDDSFRN